MLRSANPTLALCTLLLTAGALAVPALSAPPKAKAPAGKSDEPAAPKSAPQVDRLPRFYAAVVNPEQRLEIQLIQDAYRDRLDDLKAQLAALTAERDAKIEDVLTPEQKKKIAALKAESKSRPDDLFPEDGPAPSGASSKPTSEKPPTGKGSGKGAAAKIPPPAKKGTR